MRQGSKMQRLTLSVGKCRVKEWITVENKGSEGGIEREKQRLEKKDRQREVPSASGPGGKDVGNGPRSVTSKIEKERGEKTDCKSVLPTIWRLEPANDRKVAQRTLGSQKVAAKQGIQRGTTRGDKEGQAIAPACRAGANTWKRRASSPLVGEASGNRSRDPESRNERGGKAGPHSTHRNNKISRAGGKGRRQEWTVHYGRNEEQKDWQGSISISRMGGSW